MALNSGSKGKSGGKGRGPPVPTSHFVEEVKELQKSDPIAKELWIAYCNEHGQGTRDPTRHTTAYLQAFLAAYEQELQGASALASHSGRGKGGGGVDEDILPEAVKIMQKRSTAFKELWCEFCNQHGVKYDPVRLGAQFVQLFFDQMAQQAVGPVPPMAMRMMSGGGPVGGHPKKMRGMDGGQGQAGVRAHAPKKVISAHSFRSADASPSHVFTNPGADFVRHFEREGYAVLRNALSRKDQAAFMVKFWEAMQHIRPEMQLEKRESWGFPFGYKGIQCAYGLSQSDFAWIPRQSEKVQSAFATLFNVRRNHLAVSLDAVIMSDRFHKDAKRPMPWFHKDQTTHEEGLSVQGIYSAGRVGPTDGGTVLVPRSHKTAYGWESQSRDANGTTRQHLVVPEAQQMDTLGLAIMPEVPENGFLLFDSKLVHANHPSTAPRNKRTKSGLPMPNRLAVAVAFAPRVRTSKETRLKKIEAYMAGRTSNHWPCDRFSLKRPRPWNFVKGGKSLPPPLADPKRLKLL